MDTRKNLLYCILMIGLLMLSACRKEDGFYVKSRAAYEGGEIYHVIEISSTNTVFKIEDGQSIILKIGVGGDVNPILDSAEKRETMWLEISGSGCTINDSFGKYIKEYPDYFTDEKYRASIQDEKSFGYSVRLPQYYEDLKIIFPEGNSFGSIEFLLWDGVHMNYEDTAKVSFYYAKNGTTLIISKGPVTIDDIPN